MPPAESTPNTEPEAQDPDRRGDAAEGGKRLEAVRICPANELPEGGVTKEVVGGRHLAVARHEGRLYGFSAICPHMRHDLSEGFLAEDGITCSSHLWNFRLSDGSCALVPEASIPVFEAQELDGWVVLLVPPQEQNPEQSRW